jgi:hypothetical protein
MKPIRVGIMQRVLLKTANQDVSAAKVLRNMDQLVKVNMITKITSKVYLIC